VLAFTVAADFVDIFEIRGTTRAQRGELLPPLMTHNQLHLRYRGFDAIQRTTVVEFFPAPAQFAADVARCELTLSPAGHSTLEIRTSCYVDHEPSPTLTYARALTAVCNERKLWRQQFPHITSDNEDFNSWINGSLQDLTLVCYAIWSGQFDHRA
jgi:glycogen debranching enzyme